MTSDKHKKDKAAPQANAVAEEKAGVTEPLPVDRETVDALVSENTQILEELEKTRKSAEESAAALTAEQDKNLRLMAEYENYKKRTLREKQQTYDEAKADALSAFLPMIDNLERALSSNSGGASLEDGVRLILKQTGEIMQNCGIDEIEAMGAKFDPNVHNAVMHVEDETLGEQEICDVFQKGYKIGDRVVRHSMVKVAN